jgi:hypothetical protein
MKALTLTQPWATLVAIGAKRIETRSWSTKYRGPLAIHAARRCPAEARRLIFEPGPIRDALRSRSPLRLGVVVATCELVDVLPIHDFLIRKPKAKDGRYLLHEAGTIWPKARILGMFGPDGRGIPPTDGHEGDYRAELPFGDFTPGRFAWLLADVKPLPKPIPAKGALGLWEWQEAAA